MKVFHSCTSEYWFVALAIGDKCYSNFELFCLPFALQYCINNRIVNYDHFADKTKTNKYNAKYKLKLADEKILPKYLIENKDIYKNWFDHS